MEFPSRALPGPSAPEPVLSPVRARIPAAVLLVLILVAVPTPPPETPPRVWEVLAVLVSEIDVTVPGLRAPRRVNVEMTPEDRNLIRRELAAFADRVARGSRGRLEIRLRVVTAAGPITTLSGPGPFWIGPRDAAPLLPEIGDAETVMVFARIGTPDGPAVPVRHLGGAVGGDRGPGGACFVGVGFRTGWIDGTGTVALHEYLHGLRWALVDVGGLPASEFPDPDEGRAGPTCCEDAPHGDGPYADHLLTRHLYSGPPFPPKPPNTTVTK